MTLWMSLTENMSLVWRNIFVISRATGDSNVAIFSDQNMSKVLTEKIVRIAANFSSHPVGIVLSKKKTLNSIKLTKRIVMYVLYVSPS